MADKCVTFGDVTIREFPIILGVNPAVNGGAPVEIGWELLETTKREVELYDFLRKDQRKTSRKSMVMSVPQRAQILMGAGYSIDEIAETVILMEEIQKQRAESIKSSGGLNEKMMEILETTGRLPFNMVRGVLGLGKPRQKMARSA
mmetsp:Transcript_149204/g.212073  ORF Transcript_149204/g.212073 Transcript_149204/m.212073 type:complete len:146 (+) Transcript_149204:67-504(+)